jgi:hypothetical protein
LCNVDEGYCGWDLMSRDFCGSDEVRQLLGNASTQAHEDAVTVDSSMLPEPKQQEGNSSQHYAAMRNSVSNDTLPSTSLVYYSLLSDRKSINALRDHALSPKAGPLEGFVVVGC